MIILIYEEEIYVKTNEEYLKSLDDTSMIDDFSCLVRPMLIFYCKEFDSRYYSKKFGLIGWHCIVDYILDNKSSFQIIDYSLKYFLESYEEFDEFIKYLYSLDNDKFKDEIAYYFKEYEYYKYADEKERKKKLYKYFKSFIDVDIFELHSIMTKDYYEAAEIENRYLCKTKIVTTKRDDYTYINKYPDINLSNDDVYILLNNRNIFMFDINDGFELYNKIVDFKNSLKINNNNDNNILMICKLNSILQIIGCDNPIFDILLYYNLEIKNIDIIEYDLTNIILDNDKFKNSFEYNLDEYCFGHLYYDNPNKFIKKLNSFYKNVELKDKDSYYRKFQRFNISKYYEKYS